MTKYTQALNTRRMSQTIAGRFRGGVLAPVMAVPLRESEGGTISQTVTYELDPIAGRMITPITAEIISVFVPLQAIDAIANPEEAYAGNTDILRDKLLAGNWINVQTEHEVSKRLGIVPRSIAGEKRVSSVAMFAHNAAVNYLRKRKYVSAALVDKNNKVPTPALIGQTVLDRLNGVLDPEDRINGSVALDLGSVKLPIHAEDSIWNGAGYTYPAVAASADKAQGSNPDITFETSAGIATIWADTAGLNGGNISLTDFYNAEKMDALVRQMRIMVDNNPEYGEEMVTRWAHGLSVDNGKTPWILNQQTTMFGADYRQATDGANLDTAQTDMRAVLSFTVPVPATELGGVIITFASVKPDETLASQPHPYLSEPWGGQNFVSDEMMRDPVPVTMRELYADVDAADEETIAFYTGYNALKQAYVNYGFNRHLDKTTVAAKTALWQLEIPMSVTPESILYPDDLEHYPFADQLAEVCTYTVSSVATIRTPTIFGPTPVEELAQIETDDIFED